MLRKIIHNTPGYVFPCHQDIPHICDCSDSPDLSTPAEFSPMRGGACPLPGEILHHFPLVRIPQDLTDQSLNTINRINEAG